MTLNSEQLGLSATVTAQGITAPDYPTLLTTLTGYFQQIYGSDAYLQADSKDGQMLALVALAIHDANNSAIACYNAFSPATAQADALTRNVKINGIARKPATHSTVDVTVTGTAGTTISNGMLKDANQRVWNLPASITIAPGGTVTVTAVCQVPGAVACVAGALSQIATPTRGWISVSNAAAAVTGTAAETDAQLRQRQSRSVALPSLTPFAAVEAAIANVAGVIRYRLCENDTGATDPDGLPAHSIAAIVDGGDVMEIARTLRGSKGQGVATWGTTSVVVADRQGNPHTVSFSRSVNVPVFVAIQLRVLAGFTTQVEQDIKAAIAAWIATLTIGDDVLISRLYSPANLGVMDGGEGRSYDITGLTIGRSAAALTTANIITAWNEVPSCALENITITVAA